MKNKITAISLLALCLLAGCEFTRSIDIHTTGSQTSSSADSDKVFNIVQAICQKYQLTKTPTMKPREHIYVYAKKVGMNTISITLDMTNPENILIKTASYPNSKIHSSIPEIAKDIEQELKANGVKYTTSRKGEAIAIDNAQAKPPVMTNAEIKAKAIEALRKAEEMKNEKEKANKEYQKIIQEVEGKKPTRNELKAQLLGGTKLVNQGKNKKAIPYLEKYLKGMNRFMKDNPPPEGATAKKSFEKDYLKGVAYLRHAYIQTGNPGGAVKVVENTAILKKWVGPKSEILDAATPAENILLISQTKLDAAEAMIAQGKEGWEPIVNSAFKSLEMINGHLMWRSMACVEKTRALCLLGRYEKGLNELNQYMAAIKRMDRGYKESGVLHQAPSTKAYLWKGKLLVGMAEQAETDEDKAKHYFDAGKCFYIVTNYGEKCQYFNKAVSAYNDVSKKFKEVSKGKTFPQFEIEAPPPHQKKRVEIRSDLNEKGEKIGEFIQIDFSIKSDDNDEDTEENKK